MEAQTKEPAGLKSAGISDETRYQLRESQKLGALGVFGLLAQAVVIGLISGAVIGVFRIAFTYLNSFSTSLYMPFVESGAFPGLVHVVGFLALLWLTAGLLLKFEPMISGSGIPQVELAQTGHYPPMKWHRVLAAKFAGTLTSLTAGLSVGREGPCVQMGAAVGVGVGSVFCGPQAQTMHRYLSGGAVSGMTAAFSSPVAGFLFAVEDMKVVLDRRMFTFLFVTAFTAWSVVHVALGLPRVFPFEETSPLSLPQHLLIVPLVLAAGALGSFYCRALVGTTLYEDRLKWGSSWVRLAVPFILVVPLLYIFPEVLTGLGPTPASMEAKALPFLFLLALLAVKMIFSCLSFASGVAGGILMPILVIGATAGNILFLSGSAFGLVTPGQAGTVMMICMSCFFAAVVRTPLTASALLLEMTGAWANAPAVIAAAFAGSWIAGRLGSEPVYDYLKRRIQKNTAS